MAQNDTAKEHAAITEEDKRGVSEHHKKINQHHITSRKVKFTATPKVEFYSPHKKLIVHITKLQCPLHNPEW